MGSAGWASVAAMADGQPLPCRPPTQPLPLQRSQAASPLPPLQPSQAASPLQHSQAASPLPLQPSQVASPRQPGGRGHMLNSDIMDKELRLGFCFVFTM